MIRISLTKGLAAAALSAAVLCFGATTAFAAEVTVAPGGGDNAAKVIQAELDKSASLGTASNPYVVNVKAGTYTIDRSLKLYSNVTLNLKGVTFKLKAKQDSNMLRIGDSPDTKKGYYYQNITVNGGTFDGNKNSSTMLKAAHAKNVTLSGVTFKNVYNSHLSEFAGIDGLRIVNCTFRDQNRSADYRKKALNPEAIQLDILNDKHFPSYRAEDLILKNVDIEGCQFINVPCGVGNHTAVLNNPFNGIKVNNCSFSGIDAQAVSFQNVINLAVTNNKINSAPRGIVVLSVGEQGLYLPSTLAKESKDKATVTSAYKAPAANQNILISGNTIVCKGTDPRGNLENEAILLKGSYLTKATTSKGGDKVPKGDHYLSGATVSGNVITTTGHGIRLRDVKNSTVGGVKNKITYTGSAKSKADFYGIQTIDHCANNVISNNEIIKPRTNGIYVSVSSQAQAISGNVITSPGKYGIDIQESKATTIANNKISKAGSHGIYVYKKSAVTTISGNTVTSAKGSGINVDLQSKASKITKNTIKSPKIHGITVHKSSKNSKIEGNTITSAKKFGIFVEVKSYASSIAKNKISSCKSHGITVYGHTKKMKITKNTIKKCKGNGIMIDGRGSKQKVTIKSNKITGGKGAKIKSAKVSISGTKKA